MCVTACVCVCCVGPLIAVYRAGVISRSPARQSAVLHHLSVCCVAGETTASCGVCCASFRYRYRGQTISGTQWRHVSYIYYTCIVAANVYQQSMSSYCCNIHVHVHYTMSCLYIHVSVCMYMYKCIMHGMYLYMTF